MDRPLGHAGLAASVGLRAPTAQEDLIIGAAGLPVVVSSDNRVLRASHEGLMLGATDGLVVGVVQIIGASGDPGVVPSCGQLAEPMDTKGLEQS